MKHRWVRVAPYSACEEAIEIFAFSASESPKPIRLEEVEHVPYSQQWFTPQHVFADSCS